MEGKLSLFDYHSTYDNALGRDNFSKIFVQRSNVLKKKYFYNILWEMLAKTNLPNFFYLGFLWSKPGYQN